MFATQPIFAQTNCFVDNLIVSVLTFLRSCGGSQTNCHTNCPALTFVLTKTSVGEIITSGNREVEKKVGG